MEITPGNPIHIIYADDDADDREFFQEGILESKLNCNLHLFEDGDDFLKYLENINGSKPDIIFLDINMPKVNGRKCLHQVRNILSLQKTPVVMLSTSFYEAQSLLDEGASLFISKANFFKDTANSFSKLFIPGWQNMLLNAKKLSNRLTNLTIK